MKNLIKLTEVSKYPKSLTFSFLILSNVFFSNCLEVRKPIFDENSDDSIDNYKIETIKKISSGSPHSKNSEDFKDFFEYKYKDNLLHKKTKKNTSQSLPNNLADVSNDDEDIYVKCSVCQLEFRKNTLQDNVCKSCLEANNFDLVNNNLNDEEKSKKIIKNNLLDDKISEQFIKSFDSTNDQLNCEKSNNAVNICLDKIFKNFDQIDEVSQKEELSDEELSNTSSISILAKSEQKQIDAIDEKSQDSNEQLLINTKNDLLQNQFIQAVREYNFSVMSIYKPQDEQIWDASLPNIAGPMLADDLKIRPSFLLYNPFSELKTDVPFQYLQPLHELAANVFYKYKECLQKNGENTNVNNIVIENDGGRIDFITLLNSVQNPNILNNKINAVVLADDISVDELKSSLYAGFFAILNSLNEGDIDKAAIGISYVSTLFSNHCHGRTIQILNKLSEIFSTSSINPTTCSGKIYKIVSNFKNQCFNKACIDFSKLDENSNSINYNLKGSEVHYKNWITSVMEDDIYVPGQNISSRDSSRNFYIPYRLKFRSKIFIKNEFMECFKKYYNVKSITDLIFNFIYDTKCNSIGYQDIQTWFESKNVEKEAINDSDTFLLKKNYLNSMLCAMGIFEAK